jgi:adenylate cyclase
VLPVERAAITGRARVRSARPVPTGPEPLPERLAGPEGKRLVRRVRRQLFAALALANLVGVAIVITCITWVLPGAPETQFSGDLALANALLGGAFLFAVIPLGVLWGEAWLRSGRRWLQEGRAPTEREVTAVLRSPGRLFLVHATTWFAAAVAFSLANALVDVELLPRVAFTVVLAGLTTSGFAYLLAERILRPLASAALSMHAVVTPRLPGVVARTLLGWMLGNGVPFIGLAITAIFALAQRDATATELAVTMLVLSSMGLVVGWWITVLGARAVADPVSSLRHGIADLAAGELDTRIEVYDGSVLGLLQAGFNDMASGLQEREVLRDLYGRQVGDAVAADALTRGVELGGEECEVAVLFVDVVGSTSIASTLPPTEVVTVLNRFFAVVVDEVHQRGGWINKFQGDATLAVFGAPAAVDDAAARALSAARAIARRLPEDVAELSAGVGVAFGTVVAGQVGHENRFEFTVIGDPVNEASRLTELSKTFDPMVLASSTAVRAAGVFEGSLWRSAGSAELRGRTRETELYQPV